MSNPAVAPLQAGTMRLGRAREHLNDFERTRRNWLDGLPAREPTVTASANDPSLWDVRFAVPHPMPMSFTLIVSDAVQNIRIALDYAAYSVVQSCGGNAKRSHFPYCWDSVDWDTNHPTKLPQVGEPWLGLIRSHQPFTNSPSGLAIGEIARLSNVDKHRFLIPHYAFTRFGGPQLIEGMNTADVEHVRTVGETGYQQGTVLGYRIQMARPGVQPPFTYPDPVTYKFGQYTNGRPGPDLDALRHAVDAAESLLIDIDKLP